MVNSFGLDTSHPRPNVVWLVLLLILAFLCLGFYLRHFALAALIIYLVIIGALLLWWFWCYCTGREDWDIPGTSGPQLQGDDDDDAGSRRSGIKNDFYLQYLQCRIEDPQREWFPNENDLIPVREYERRWFEYRRNVYGII